MRTPIRIAFIQKGPRVGAIQGNLSIIGRKAIALAGMAGLLDTSKCCGTGYPRQDLALRPGFLAALRSRLQSKAADLWRKVPDAPALMTGGLREGTNLSHDAMFLPGRDGSIRVTRKHPLANAEAYGGVRTFQPGLLPVPMLFRGWRLPITNRFGL